MAHLARVSWQIGPQFCGCSDIGEEQACLDQRAVVNRVGFVRVKITKQLQKRFEPLVLPSGRGEQVPLDPFSPEPFEVASALPSRSRIHCRLRYQVSVSHSALTTAHQEKFIRALSQQLTCPEKGRGFTWALEKLTRWLRMTTKLNSGTAAEVPQGMFPIARGWSARRSLQSNRLQPRTAELPLP